MNDKETYRLIILSQIEQRKAELDTLKAKASSASMKSQKEMNTYFRWIGFMIDESISILSDLKKSSGNALSLIQIGLENSLNALKSSIEEANTKLKQS